ncbi:hypothetical protein C7974DRAFT_167922 [Boeremia exigua]|uniref:uncharacterized protein n=1 Tax=Boeremia exigua TaxID=749465 RepID=UPI001E8D7E6D|nr:uncharacterized protein C7974DRAFT_167922 [Boeremia exigua]KAH6633229.1 hypothetical protein C7974DRAFT_167922 [Boeremia exigua]
MRPFTTTRTCNTALRQLSKPTVSHISRFTTSARMSSAEAVPGIPSQSSSSLNIENTDIQTASGVTLSSQQQTVVGSILDLFAGRPSLKKLALWRDDATFEDPITIAQGRDKYQAQWYGLQSAFSKIERQHHSVTDAGNPILMDMKTKYVVKGIGMEQIVSSVVAIHLDGEGKIQKVEDKWNGKLPEGAIANAFRHLNAVTVPKLINVPKNDKEDAERGN